MKNLVSAFATLFLFSSLASAAGGATSSIAMEQLGKSPYFVVQVQINQGAAEKFLVDTGATDTVLSDWYVDEKKIQTTKSEQKFFDGNGHQTEALLAKIKSLRIGFADQSNQMVPVVPSPAAFKQMRIAGILSPQSVFQGKPFLLDFPRKKIEAGDISHLTRRSLVTSEKLRPCSNEKPNKFVVSGKMAEVAGEYYIDTGAGASTLKTRFAPKSLIQAGSGSESQGLASKTKAISIPKAITAVGPIEQESSIEVVEKDGCENSHGRIGNVFWMNYAVWFDKERKTLKLYK